MPAALLIVGQACAAMLTAAQALLHSSTAALAALPAVGSLALGSSGVAAVDLIPAATAAPSEVGLLAEAVELLVAGSLHTDQVPVHSMAAASAERATLGLMAGQVVLLLAAADVHTTCGHLTAAAVDLAVAGRLVVEVAR